ncbi:hypothetical protein Taro_003640 [Colocasia esculenta]|uniref:Uncharacterized protein n=1 Tax=Colocasia esculenta TaxID=4460 RepID=A0A843TPF7_COLES|nr:hypothetical protein [Colocasia esculenta]
MVEGERLLVSSLLRRRSSGSLRRRWWREWSGSAVPPAMELVRTAVGVPSACTRKYLVLDWRCCFLWNDKSNCTKRNLARNLRSRGLVTFSSGPGI